jgi:hypothetical protein
MSERHRDRHLVDIIGVARHIPELDLNLNAALAEVGPELTTSILVLGNSIDDERMPVPIPINAELLVEPMVHRPGGDHVFVGCLLYLG